MHDTATPPPAFGRPLLMRGGEKNSRPGKEGRRRSGRAGPPLPCDMLLSTIFENIDKMQRPGCPYAFSSRFSSFKKRQSVPCAMIFCGLA